MLDWQEQGCARAGRRNKKLIPAAIIDMRLMRVAVGGRAVGKVVQDVYRDRGSILLLSAAAHALFRCPVR